MTLTHNEVQTCSSIVVIGSVGILAASFFIDHSFLEGIDWVLNPLTHFMVGGLLLIVSGCALLLFYHDQKREWAANTYDTTLVLGLFLIIVAAVQIIIRYLSANA